MRNLGYGSEESRIKTVLVFKDPSDWYVDLQVITDVCVGGQSSTGDITLLGHKQDVFSCLIIGGVAQAPADKALTLLPWNQCSICPAAQSVSSLPPED